VTNVVLDASAVLALVFAEAGADAVAARLPNCLISAANYAEVLTRSVDRGQVLGDTISQVGRLKLTIWPFDAGQAATAASLRSATRRLGLSLADRCCLALALSQGLPILTADKAWKKLDLGIAIELIR
jgi:ribonuclease VapC